jgi:C4-dicarboxylate-specific signal transduction histidine kinase
MAEVATGVLHNIGNVLNSVNTSATVATDSIESLKIPGVGKVAQLLREQGDRLAAFFTEDPRGRQLPGYLDKLAALMETQRAEALKELKVLQSHIEHIKEIVVLQQSHARVSGVSEVMPASELIENALQMSGASLDRHGVTVTREYVEVPPVKVERQRALQVLVNLIRNAQDAMAESTQTQKRLVLGIRKADTGRVQIRVSDNGVGIAPENITRIFAFGFTTKKEGHGFGLHSSALVARELGGALWAESAGVGKGATFVMELPLPSKEGAASAAPASAPAETNGSSGAE